MQGLYRLLALAAWACAALLAMPAAAQDCAHLPDLTDRGSARLVVERSIAAGESGALAIDFVPDEGWHGYWSNPGDAGQGICLDWTLPDGWTVGEPLYPVPQTYVVQGLMNHIFEGEHAVLLPLAVPPGTPAGAYPVGVYAEWLTCSETLCVPQRAALSSVVQVGEGGETNPRFAEWRSAIPPLLDRKAQFAFGQHDLRVAIPLPQSMALTTPHLFLAEDGVVDYAAPQVFRRQGDWLIAQIPRARRAMEPAALSGIVALGGARDGLRFEAVPGDVPEGGEIVGDKGPGPFWLLIGGALLGGLLLNLMPCVFPILSLKALTLARAGESEAMARREALSYTAGVVLACLALGALMLVLRAGGSQVGWAFQLQEPLVVAALLVLAAAITANLAGLYELPSLPITRRGGKASSFATGLLAAFAATPCTGPFMAAALGAALLLPWAQALLLFGALGLGLALPFLLLGFVPALRSRLPRPGAWMDRFRKAMAVPMGLTALALVWLAWRLGGPAFAAAAAALALALVLFLALFNRRRGPALGLAALALLGFALLPATVERAQARGESLLETADFSPEALAAARATGKPVFLYFTADWCLTCKVNEQVAIEREATRAAFEKAGVITMRGDWTLRDEEIADFLTDHGAAGVPLYLWYPPGGAEPEQLPQVLTPGLLAEMAGG